MRCGVGALRRTRKITVNACASPQSLQERVGTSGQRLPQPVCSVKLGATDRLWATIARKLPAEHGDADEHGWRSVDSAPWSHGGLSRTSGELPTYGSVLRSRIRPIQDGCTIRASWRRRLRDAPNGGDLCGELLPPHQLEGVAGSPTSTVSANNEACQRDH